MSSNAAEKIDEGLPTSYRDEMNFAEFPLALLGAPAPGQKTIEFSDDIFDYKRDIWITRKLTISASDRSSLPTPRDEEVFLGLINLSHQNNFESREVFFTKGELVKLLGWSDDGRSYQRIDEALKKWASLTLYWENWWSKEEMAFIDRTFHILDNVDSISKERYRTKVANAGGNPRAGLSSFAWNSVIFSSFKSGYIKKLDLNFYKNLDTALSKKIYRFLDKRFYNEARIELKLHAFAFEHIGLSRSYHNSQIKRLLDPAIRELEAKGFLKPLDDAHRYIKEARGLWKIVFIRARGGKVVELLPDNGLSKTLVERGVTQKVALELVRQYDNASIQKTIDSFDKLVSSNDKKISKNPAGFLVAAIRNDFVIEPKKAPPQRRNSEPKPARPTPPTPHDLEMKKQQEEFSSYWNTLSETEKESFETAAVQKGDNFSVTQYKNGKVGRGPLFEAVRQNLLIKHFKEGRGENGKG